MRTKSQRNYLSNYANVTKNVHRNDIEITLNSKENRQKTQSRERRKTSFLKEQVENPDLYKSVLNKIVTMHKYCIK